jgi:hypothetical protein
VWRFAQRGTLDSIPPPREGHQRVDDEDEDFTQGIRMPGCSE